MIITANFETPGATPEGDHRSDRVFAHEASRNARQGLARRRTAHEMQLRHPPAEREEKSRQAESTRRARFLIGPLASRESGCRDRGLAHAALRMTDWTAEGRRGARVQMAKRQARARSNLNVEAVSPRCTRARAALAETRSNSARALAMSSSRCYSMSTQSRAHACAGPRRRRCSATRAHR